MQRENLPFISSGTAILLAVLPLAFPSIPPVVAGALICAGLSLIAWGVYADWRSSLQSWREWATQLIGLIACAFALVWLNGQGGLSLIGWALVGCVGLVMAGLLISMHRNLRRTSPLSPYMPLKDAAVEVYSAARKMDTAGLPELMVESQPDRIITWYCFTIWRVCKVFGTHPPSTAREEIPRKLKGVLTFRDRDGELVLEALSGRGAKFANLEILRSELPRAIAKATGTFQPEDNVDDRMPLNEAAQVCFDLTGLWSDWPISGDARLQYHLTNLIIEAREHPDRLAIWGVQLPSSDKFEKVPSDLLVSNNLLNKGGHPEIHVPRVDGGWDREWIKLSVSRRELLRFAERLVENQTAGQQAPHASTKAES